MGLFFSFEGPDGSGKSTQARLLAHALRDRGIEVTETREPGGTPLGEGIRSLVLDPSGPSQTPLTSALLLSASRSQLVTDVITPSREAGRTVIVDRYADSTVAYQCYGAGLDVATARALESIATHGVSPDIRIYVDVPVDVGLARVSSRGGRNRLDRENVAYHERVRAGYLEMIRDNPAGWIVIDGTKSPDIVHTSIVEAVEPMLREVGAA